MASVFPGALDNITANKVNATLQKIDHPTHHNALADAINAVESYLLTGRGGSSFVLDASANFLITMAASTNFARVVTPDSADSKGGLYVGNLLPSEVGATDFWRVFGIYQLNTVADGVATELHTIQEIIGGFTYGSAVSAISAGAMDINVTIEDDFNHSAPAIYAIGGAFTYNGTGALNSTGNGFVTGLAGNLVNATTGTIHFGSVLQASSPDNNHGGTLDFWSGLDVKDQAARGGTFTGALYGARFRSQFTRVTTGDSATVRVEMSGIAAGIGSVAGNVMGLYMPTGATVLLGSTTSNVTNIFQVYIGQTTFDSTTLTRTVTGVMATFVIQGPPLKTARVSHATTEYSFAILSGPSYLGGNVTFVGATYLSDFSVAQAVSSLYAGNGAPGAGEGADGDFYFRGDGTVAGNTVVYHKQGGGWVALVTA